MELPQLDNYKELFLNDTPMLDVRAPVEFMQGAFPHTQNLPLMNDDERKNIGIEYKELGQDKAIELGHKLVSGEIKQQRMNAWQKFVENNPQGVLYCFRGGLRSRITQQWIYEQTGITYPRVKGGYKAMRSYLLEELKTSTQTIKPIILSGRTGVGKTLLLQDIETKIDLEGIYQHRGSAFGNRVTPQPSQIDVENQLAIEFIKLREKNANHLVMEDESRSIGSRKLPDQLFETMRHSPIIIVDAAIEKRVDIVFEEYITHALEEHQQAYGEAEGFTIWSTNLLNSLGKIERRLGGLRHKQALIQMEDAIYQHQFHSESKFHREWIQALLEQYYDPMYDYQLSKKTERIIFRGEDEAVLAFLREQKQVA